MSIEEVLQAFRENWPTKEEFDNQDQFSTVKLYKEPGERRLQTHYWTPGGLVWLDPEDGHELWSTDAVG